MGDWLQAHKDLPLDQQLKLLENEPGFKKLPADRQAALRERLKKFNSLPPDKRDQALQRMEFLSKLTPQQRQQLRIANEAIERPASREAGRCPYGPAPSSPDASGGAPAGHPVRPFPQHFL